MTRQQILLPMFGIMLLTLVVWIVMYIRRTSLLVRKRIDLRKLDTPDKAALVIPTDASLRRNALLL